MCAELTERLEWFIAEDETNENDPGNQYWLTGKKAGIDSVTRARALLDQPVAEGPTLKEVSEFIDKEAPKSWNFGAQHHDVMRIILAAITRWGRPTPQPPADGEVAELVEWLTTLRDHDLQHVAPYSHPSIAHWHGFLTRAAELLERPTPQPVAVSERLQAVEALAADAVSGLRYIEQTHGRLYGVGWDRVFDAAAKVLPANALPTPEANDY
jgi:hypothetical protein